jgi:hypothetical protein
MSVSGGRFRSAVVIHSGMPYELKLPDAFRRARQHRRAARPGPIGLGMVLHRRVVHF